MRQFVRPCLAKHSPYTRVNALKAAIDGIVMLTQYDIH